MSKFVPFELDSQRAMVALAVLLTVLPTCVVGLRIWARRTSKQRLRWSDFWIVANNAVLLAYWSLFIFAVVYGGVGKPGSFIRHQHMILSEKYTCRSLQTLELLFGFSTLFLKLSTLSLLKELFCTTPKAKTVHKVLTYATLVVGTVATTATLVLNFPADRACDPGVKLSDDEQWKMVYDNYFNYVSTMVLDVAIFAVPIWQLYPLRMKSRKKVGVMVAFSLGSLTCVVAVIRMALSFSVHSWHVNTMYEDFMMGLEPSVGIIAVSVPLCSPLFQRRRRTLEGVEMHEIPSKVELAGPRHYFKSVTTTATSSSRQSQV